MPFSWSRKDKRKGGLQPAAGDPEEELSGFCGIQHPKKGRGLSRILRLLWQEVWVKNGRKQRRASQETPESRRGAGMQGQTAKRCAELGEKAPALPEEPGTCQKATRGGASQQEEETALVTAVNVLRAVPHLRENGWDEPAAGREARGGDVPSGGGGHRGEMGQGQLPGQAGGSGDKEGRTTGSPRSPGGWGGDRPAATVPGGNGERQDFSPSSAEAGCGGEPRRRVREKLQRLGEDMAGWDGRSTRELAVRLVEVILRTPTSLYPMETGKESGPRELELGRGRAGAEGGSSEEVGALVGVHADITAARQHQQLQDLAGYHDVSVGGTVDEDDPDFLALLKPFGSEETWEDSDDDLLEQGDPPPVPRPEAAVCCLTVLKDGSKEQWREEFPDVWARYETDCGLVSEEVKVSGAPVPFQQQRPFPAAVDNVVAGILRGLLEDGVVVEGRSSSNSPLCPILKANGKTRRLLLNCKAINKATPMVVAPVDLGMAKLLANLSPRSRYFSTVDLSNAAFAIPLAVSSRARFAFTFRGQQYLFTRLPQGFHSTTSIVHQRVKQMLSQLAPEDQPWVVSYTDDILVTGETRKETEDRTREVLKLIQKTGFKAKLEKAQLVQPEVDYLGMTIWAKGRKIQASRMEAIRKAPSPRDVGSLRSLMGQFYSLRDYIPNYWQLARPFHRLLAGQVDWDWGPEQEQALDRLKRAVQAAPTLRFPDRSQPFVIRLTTGNEEVGATLLQEEERGRLVPVCHSSRVLKAREVSCPPREKRCLAAVWAVQAFKTLTGPAPVLIQLPHSPCKYLLRGEVLGSHGTNPQPAQWSLLLVNWGVAGGRTARGPQPEGWGRPPVPTAPSLQELPSHVPKATVWFLATRKGCSVGFAAANLEERWLLGVAEEGSGLGAELVALGELLRRHQRSSPLYVYTSCPSLAERLQSQMEERETEPWATSGDDLWPSILRWVHDNPEVLHIRYLGGHGSMEPEEKKWRQKVDRRAWEMSGRDVGNQPVWEPSKYEKQEIIARCHGWMHEGVEETLARVRRVAPWEGDSGQVARWVQSCPECAAGRDGAGRVQPQRSEGPWSQLHLGYINGLPKTEEGHGSLLVVEDEFSGWVEAFPLREETVQEMAQVLYERVFAQHGTPRIVYVPQVPEILWNVTRLVMKTSGVKLLWAILQREQGPPATPTLQQAAWGAGKAWVEMLPLILAGSRATKARGEALSPYRIIPGFPLEMRWGCEEETGPEGDNVLLWLKGLQEGEDGYRHRTEAALSEEE